MSWGFVVNRGVFKTRSGCRSRIYYLDFPEPKNPRCVRSMACLLNRVCFCKALGLNARPPRNHGRN